MPEEAQPGLRKQLGEPLRWSEEELDALSEVTPQDVVDAQASVRQHATQEGAALWEAVPAEDETQ